MRRSRYEFHRRQPTKRNLIAGVRGHSKPAKVTTDSGRNSCEPRRERIEAAPEIEAKGRPAKLGTRSLDVLHIASALELELRIFVTHDSRQEALARAVGLKTLAPGK
jgi:predicted nucleic acid-binding protein